MIDLNQSIQIRKLEAQRNPPYFLGADVYKDAFDNS